MSSGPADGARFRGRVLGLAIDMDGISPDDYEAKALEYIQTIQPLFDAAPVWPEAREFAAANDACARFDRGKVQREVLEANARETARSATAALCVDPIAAQVGFSRQLVGGGNQAPRPETTIGRQGVTDQVVANAMAGETTRRRRNEVAVLLSVDP